MFFSGREIANVRFGSISPLLAEATRPFMSAMPPIATKPVSRSEASRCAKTGCEQSQQRDPSFDHLVSAQHDCSWYN
jgi:hypothetical protein